MDFKKFTETPLIKALPSHLEAGYRTHKEQDGLPTAVFCPGQRFASVGYFVRHPRHQSF